MRIKFDRFKLKKDLDSIIVLHWIHFIFVLLTLIVEIKYGHIKFSASIFKILVILILYKMYFKTVKNFYYTFWTFSFFLAIYLFFGLFQSYFIFDNGALTRLYFITIIILLLESYLISSPIFFPKVGWWEYDFRYRDDLKVDINKEDKTLSGRLTDLRRNAGCVILFENFKAGEIINLKTQDGHIELVAEIISKRESAFGRGIIYGVKFHFKNFEEKNTFTELCRYFAEKKYSVKKNKFENFKDV